jgi:hypothetical protein
MTHRLNRLNQCLQAHRDLLTWVGIAAAGAVIAAIAFTSNANAADAVGEEGLRNKAGVAYGEGAVYTVTSGGETWSFHVPGSYGWETTIVFAADLDGDRKPDFIVQINGQETLLLSSRAKAGLNPPAAVLAVMSDGC